MQDSKSMAVRALSGEGDTIYRQQAIEAVVSAMIDGADAELVEGIMEMLPSAQPERLEQPETAKEYCAECDHIEMCQWYPFEGCEFRSLPSAQPERKTGRWVDDGGLYKCSNCNHLFSELWWVGNCPIDRMKKIMRFCPNCGADMRGENDDSD